MLAVSLPRSLRLLAPVCILALLAVPAPAVGGTCAGNPGYPNDPDYAPAHKKQNGASADPDDIGYALWGADKLIYAIRPGNITTNDEILAALQLELLPSPGLFAWLVSRVQTFRDNAFKLELADSLDDLLQTSR